MQGQAIKYALKRKDTNRQKAIKNATSKIKIAHQRQKGRPKKPRTTPQGKLLSQAKQAEIHSRISITTKREEDKLKRARQKKEELERLEVRRPTLEQVYLSLVEDQDE